MLLVFYFIAKTEQIVASASTFIFSLGYFASKSDNYILFFIAATLVPRFFT